MYGICVEGHGVVCACVDLTYVLAVGVEVVVDGVEEGVAGDLGATAGRVVDVVTLEGDHVVGAGEVDEEVVVAVAVGRPVGGAVELGVGDGDTVGGSFAEDKVLAADAGGLDVVDPDHVSAGDGDSITTPDVLRVDLGEVDVLDDDVLDTVGHVDTLALDDTGGALADKRLVGLDLDGVPASLVVGQGADLGGVGLVLCAPL